MKIITLALSVFIPVLIFSCKGEQKKKIESDTKVEDYQKAENDGVILEIVLSAKSNSNVSGNVTFMTDGEMVTMTASLYGLSKGVHAMHIHEKADCFSSDGKSTGGHWNPTMEPHGEWGAKEGYHKGDIGNFEAGEDGEGAITFATNDWCIGCGDEKKDILGKAIIVHEGTDDYTSQPSGAAGSRVSCGAIIK